MKHSGVTPFSKEIDYAEFDFEGPGGCNGHFGRLRVTLSGLNHQNIEKERNYDGEATF